jgi:fucose 4-O-acetylase-like acetyltransferase
MMAVFFIGMGFMLRKMEWWISNYMMAVFMIVIPVSLQIEPTSMSTKQTFVMWLLIPYTGLAGFALVYKFSNVVAQNHGKTADCLSYIGRQTFYIMTFHFLMFKPASLLKAYIFGMDWRVIGYHPVIPPDGDNWYWLVYSISSIVLSLVLTKLIKCISSSKLIVNHKIK